MQLLKGQGSGGRNSNSRSSKMNSMKEFKKQVADWSAGMQLELGTTQEEEVIEAKAYFGKRCPKILEYLKLLSNNFNPLPKKNPDQSNNNSRTTFNQGDNHKDPPTIVSARIYNDNQGVYDLDDLSDNKCETI